MASIYPGTTVNANGFSHYGGSIPEPTLWDRAVNYVSGKVTSLTGNGLNGLSGLSSSAKPSVPTSSGYYPESSAKASIDYYNAPLSEKYGMSAETAYQEALSNTAHQREMQDLKAAGLNPVLTVSGGRGADTFGGAQLASGGGTSGGATAGSSQLTAKAILKDYNARSAIASLGSAAVTSMTGNFALGAAAYYGTNAALGFISQK